MALSIAGFVVIGTATPSEDPVRVGYVWMDVSTSKLKICTSVTPITFTEVGGVGGASTWGAITGTLSDQTDLQTALNAKQPLDGDLTTIAGLTATTDNVLQSVASAWASRTPAQLKTTLVLVKADVGLGNVDNTSDANKPVSTATQTALNGKADSAHATQHKLGGADPIALDELDVPADNTDLDATAASHGLLPKLSGSASDFMRGDGAWAAPAGTGLLVQSFQQFDFSTGDGQIQADYSCVINRKLVLLSTSKITIFLNGRLRIL